MPNPDRRELRLRRVITLLSWLTLALGVFLSFFDEGATTPVIVAAVLGGTYVVGLQMIPISFLSRQWLQDLVTTAGILLTMTASGLTGGVASPYLLLSLSPVLVAATLGGLRPGLAASTLGIAALTIITFATASFDISAVLEWVGLILLVAITSAQARRVLLESRAREMQLTKASARAMARIERLSRANSLLSRFIEEADSRELNPVTVGSSALEELSDSISMDGGVIALAGNDGPVVVARAGEERPGSTRTVVPLSVGERSVGFVAITSQDELTRDDQTVVHDLLQPVALAFGNVLLLQDIAQRAVREERQRLARDLHDEIGPSLASLGLAVDLALLRHPADPDLAQHLQTLRSSVTGLVEDVRSTVADLRMSPQPSIGEVVRRIAGELPEDSPMIDIRLEERRPPRPSLAPDIAAIVVEALRNAIAHSGATTIIVHGSSDFDEGRITVFDDGTGFDRDEVPAARFGLVGMEERAERMGASLNILSTNRGTTVTVAWGPE